MLVLSRTRPLVALLILAIVVFVTRGLTFAPSASAASDTTGPVLVNSSVGPKAFNFQDGPATVKVTLRLTDKTGVRAPVVSLGHDGTGQSHGFGEMTRVSGTMQDGTWERSMTIPQGSATGQWGVTLFPLRDTLGNASTSFQTLGTITIADMVASEVAVSPAAVTFTDKDGTAADTYTVPATTGVEYRVGDKVVAAETYPGTGSVTVTAAAGAGYILASGSVSSWTTIFRGLLAGAVPTVMGTAKVGSTLTAKHGIWGPSPVVFQYQWYRSGVAVIGATSANYRLTAADAGKTLTVKVTGSKAGYTTVSRTSAATAAAAK